MLPDVGASVASDDERSDLDRRRADGTVVWGPDTFRSPLVALMANAQGRLVIDEPAPPAADRAEHRRRIRALAAAILKAA